MAMAVAGGRLQGLQGLAGYSCGRSRTRSLLLCGHLEDSRSQSMISDEPEVWRDLTYRHGRDQGWPEPATLPKSSGSVGQH
jgi:hypothetical protein